MRLLSIAGIFKNETPYLKEWIEYHKLVGVEHFYLYDNDNEDLGFHAVLEPYIKAGDVTLTHWKDQNKEAWGEQLCAWVYTTQVSAYEDAIKKSTGKTKWLACIDIDEFIVPVKESSIVKMLSKYGSDIPGIEILWEIFGTSHIDTIPPEKLMIELLHLTSKIPSKRHHKKTIFRPELYNGFFQPPHTYLYTNGSKSIEVPKEEMVINHYTNKCNDYFFNIKMKHKLHMENISEDQLHIYLFNANDQEDENKHIHKFIPKLKEKMGFST